MIVNRHLTAPALACLCGYFVLASTCTWISLPTCFLATASLEFSELQRRRDELRSLLRRIKFPPIDSFTVDGVTYGLPLKAIPPPKGKPTREELEYLCGFFDGDGCVTMEPKGFFRLAAKKSIRNAHILLRFRDVFGGGVYASDLRTGFSESILEWQVTSKSASLAAGLMATVPCMKQSQLAVAASGTVESVHRSQVKAKLKAMKQKNYIHTSLAVTWRYFAGFFDAEGCIGVRASIHSLTLVIAQANPTVLEFLLAFLQDQRLDRWKLLHYSKASYLKCQHHQTSKVTLKHLLHNGLSVKRQQAKIAMELTPANRQKIREELSLLTGRQGRYRRLDEAGCLRAREIRKLREGWHRSSCAEKRKQLEVELMRLREEHAFAKLVSECQTLESDIDMMVADGGQLPQSCDQAWSEKVPDMATGRCLQDRSPSDLQSCSRLLVVRSLFSNLMRQSPTSCLTHLIGVRHQPVAVSFILGHLQLLHLISSQEAAQLMRSLEVCLWYVIPIACCQSMHGNFLVFLFITFQQMPTKLALLLRFKDFEIKSHFQSLQRHWTMLTLNP